MKTTFFTFLIAVFAISLHAQTVNLDWVNTIGGTALDRATSIATDNVGNTYTTGYFRYTADFDPGANISTLSSSGFAAFVCKFSPAGNLIWARAYETNGQSYGHSIAVDINDNVLVTGYFTGTIDLDPGVDSLNITSAGGNDAFISKLDSAGNLVWGKTLSGTSAENGYAVTADNSGNVYTVGNFSGTTDFNPGGGTSNLTATSSSDIYISKLSDTGNFLWAKRIGVGGSNGLVYGFSKYYGVAMDASDHLYVTGHFAGVTDFGTDTLTAVNDWDVFICMMNPSGTFAWEKQMGGSGTDVGIGIKVDASGNIYTCGAFSQTVDFDWGTGTQNLTASGNTDVYVAKYSSTASLVWVKQIGSSGIDVGYGIATDNTGGVYTTGIFSGAVDFNPDAGTNVMGTTGDDVFVLRLNNIGTYSLAYVLGTPTANNDEGMALAVDDNFNIYSAGHYAGDIDFDQDTASIDLHSSNGNEDIFVHKVTQCLAAFHTVTPTACFSYSLNGQDYTSSGSYTQVFNNAAGCDSFLIINLTINNVDVSVYQTGSIISCNELAGNYQWLYCDSTMNEITGETGYQYYPSVNGNYAVAVTVNGCSDTSICTNVTNVGIEENSIANNFDLYPNLTTDVTQINYHLSSGIQKAQIELVSVTGAMLQKSDLNVHSQKQLLDVSTLPSGIYFCCLIADNKNAAQKKLVIVK